LIGENPDKDKDFFLLNCRWLRYPNIHLEVEDQQYLWNRMGGQLDMRRRGGSNGQNYSIDWYKFFQAIQRPGMCPRKAHGAFWILKKKEILCVYMKKSIEERKVVSFPYGLPKHEGQVNLCKRFLNGAPTNVRKMFQITATTRYLTSFLIEEINKQISESNGIFNLYNCRVTRKRKLKKKNNENSTVCFVDRNTASIQSFSNKLAKEAVKNGTHKNICEYLLLNCSITCMCDAVDLHIDIPKKNGGNNGFVETRTLVQVNFLSTFDIADPPLGRGGAGPGKFVIALIDHPYGTFVNRTGGDNWYEFKNQHGIQMTVPHFFKVVRDRNHVDRDDANTARAVRDFECRERRNNRSNSNEN